MTKLRRIINFVIGIIYILVALMLFLDPEDGLNVAVLILNLTFFFRGVGGFFYYVTMGRHMVGGKTAMYRGLIYLDLFVFTSAVLTRPDLYLMFYLVGVNIFEGLVDLLRGREERAVGNPAWIFQIIYGVTDLIVAVAVIISSLFLKSVWLMVYVYAVGMIYKGCVRIISAFRRTAIIFVQ